MKSIQMPLRKSIAFITLVLCLFTSVAKAQKATICVGDPNSIYVGVTVNKTAIAGISYLKY